MEGRALLLSEGSGKGKEGKGKRRQGRGLSPRKKF